MRQSLLVHEDDDHRDEEKDSQEDARYWERISARVTECGIENAPCDYDDEVCHVHLPR